MPVRSPATTRAPALLIALPGGLYVSGVATWAVRLVNALAELGHDTGLILHRSVGQYAPLAIPTHPRVRLFHMEHLPAVEACHGEIEQYVPDYQSAIAYMSGNGPVVLSPNLHGDCYGIAAAAAARNPDRVRCIGWCHLDSAYDRAVLAHYAPSLSAFVAVSHATRDALAHMLPDREVYLVPYGVPVAPAAPRRDFGTDRPWRILYAGRVEEGVKRISTLIDMSDCLSRSGVPHRLTIIGDGPATTAIDAAAAQRAGRITRVPPVPPDELADQFAAADLFVLPSRAEGLSLAMLEALGQGCIPVVSRVRSGAQDVIEHGLNGQLVEPDEDNAVHGARFADTIKSVHLGDPELTRTLSFNAWRSAANVSIARHAHAVVSVLRQCAAAPAPLWPAGVSFAFTGSAAIVPAGAADRIRRVLNGLPDQRIILHGAGRHTRELCGVFGEFASRIVAVTDDNPEAYGSQIGPWTVQRPPGPTGATAVVLSSYIHQEDMAARAGVFRGMKIVRLYE
ncbi:MAG: glycosyltransferase family 4 protein [Planctomycetes bacterium]|nr:glycosyltransferase family 4 protein [Planctomycetota bacterium]